MPAPLPIVDVAVGVVRNAQGRVLFAQRTPRQVAAGFWELPGGKIDADETAADAAARELREETGIEATRLRPWRRDVYAFRTKRVRLHFFHVERWVGQPHGREGQRLAWVDPAAPSIAPVLPSNLRALRALALPALCAVVDADDGVALTLDRVAGACAQGVRLFQLKAGTTIAPDQLAALARRVAGIAALSGGQVLLAGSPQSARRAGVAGLHFPSAQLRGLAAPPASPFWSASCHDAADVQRAEALGADVVFVSPVLPGRAHPGAVPLGWEGLAALARATALPVYAQGGLSARDAQQARAHGAVGVAIAIESLARAGLAEHDRRTAAGGRA